MKTKTLLTVAKNILVEKDWTQGDWATFTKADGTKATARLRGGKLMVGGGTEYDLITKTYEIRDGKVIPVTKVEAVCAMGAIELALASKDYDGDTEQNITDPCVNEARRLLEQAIYEGVEIDPYVRTRYDEYVEDELRYGATEDQLISLEAFAREFEGDDEGVEGWNDREGRTKREVIEAFERAIALA